MQENLGKKPTRGQMGANTPQTFTKERVNELMQKRVERSHQAFFNRYGVKDLKELDDLFNRSNSVDSLNQKIEELTKGNTDWQAKYDELANNNRELTKKYAFTSRNIRPELYNDIETYFKGKGIDINEDTLNEELKTHLDWCNKAGVVTDLGSEPHETNPAGEKELASKLLGVEL